MTKKLIQFCFIVLLLVNQACTFTSSSERKKAEERASVLDQKIVTVTKTKEPKKNQWRQKVDNLRRGSKYFKKTSSTNKKESDTPSNHNSFAKEALRAADKINSKNNSNEKRFFTGKKHQKKCSNIALELTVPNYMVSCDLGTIDEVCSFCNSIKDIYAYSLTEPIDSIAAVFPDLYSYDSNRSPLEDYMSLQKAYTETSDRVQQFTILDEGVIPNTGFVEAWWIVSNKKMWDNGKVLSIHGVTGYYRSETDFYVIDAWGLEGRKEKQKDILIQIIKSAKYVQL